MHGLRQYDGRRRGRPAAVGRAIPVGNKPGALTTGSMRDQFAIQTLAAATVCTGVLSRCEGAPPGWADSAAASPPFLALNSEVDEPRVQLRHSTAGPLVKADDRGGLPQDEFTSKSARG